MVHPDQTLFALTKAHERFYADEVATVAPARLLLQPENKGTAPAIACSLVRVLDAEPEALVAFFPSDHYFANEEALNNHIESAYTLAECHSELVVLLGDLQIVHGETGDRQRDAQPRRVRLLDVVRRIPISGRLRCALQHLFQVVESQEQRRRETICC